MNACTTYYHLEILIDIKEIVDFKAMEAPVAVYYEKRGYKRSHNKKEEDACCLEKFSEIEREECLSDFPQEIVKQNQLILNLLHQFGDQAAKTETQLNEVEFKLAGKIICEDCLCILFKISDQRYQRIKTFYQVGAKVITHGNYFSHHQKKEQTLVAGAWLTNYLQTYSEPMPHADIHHLHVPTKRAVFTEKPAEAQVSESALYKLWDKKIKIPTKNQIFARCPECQGIRKRCFEAGKSATAMDALNRERKLHKELYMAEKQSYYDRQVRSVDQPDEVLCIIYDGMHKEKTKLPRFCRNPAKDLEEVPRTSCNLLGFICHRQGLNNFNKQGVGILNMNYPDNANFILSALLHVIKSVARSPFPRNLSCQFDNASNNKCNVAFGLFAYLVSEGIFYNVYGNTLLVNHTHEDVDRMFENVNEKLRKADMVIPAELASLMQKVPYVTDVGLVPCVWDLTSFLTPFMRTTHDFGNVHHVWLHKNVEGNVVMHYKRYSKDQWLPDSQDATTYLTEEDRYGILIFKELPHGTPHLEDPSFMMGMEERKQLNSGMDSLFKHPMLQDGCLKERKAWWNDYLEGKAFIPKQTTWPFDELKERRQQQNMANREIEMEVTEGLTHVEADMPMVYSGPYLPPAERERASSLNVARNSGQWPIKKIVKERINQRTHKKEFMVEWKPSWVPEKDVDCNLVSGWKRKKR